MSDFVQSIKDAMLARIKNPIAGTFVIAWLLVNIKIIIEFFLLNNQEKIVLLHSAKFEYTSDLVWPILLSLGYLYLMPTMNFLHETLFELKLDEVRHQTKQNYLLNFYKLETKIAIQKAKSKDEYAQKVLDKELENWSTDKRNLVSMIENRNFDNYKYRDKDFNNISNENALLHISINEAQEKIDKLNEEIQNLKNKQ